MFRRNKPENKPKLEHKLYLARESPEPVFDLAGCDLRQVPPGIYSLCRVFLKEALFLQDNCLSSLGGGGELKDLRTLHVLDLHNNAFDQLPDDIQHLTNLRELYLNNNLLKKLPDTICNLSELRILNLKNNGLKYLPHHLGQLTELTYLDISQNAGLTQLPKSMYRAQRLSTLKLDPDNFTFPPKEIVRLDAKAIINYICDGLGESYTYTPSHKEDVSPAVIVQGSQVDDVDAVQQQKLKAFLETEKANEIAQRQEFEMAIAQKLNKEKLLSNIAHQQNNLDVELTKLQQQKDIERFKLIEKVIESENRANLAISQLLKSNYQPIAQLLAHEKQEDNRLICAANKYHKDLRKQDILNNMQDILEQELNNFKMLDRSRMLVSKSILEQEIASETSLREIIHSREKYRNLLMLKLQQNNELQKAAVGTLLERGDARSWGLVQQLKLVEIQLAALTKIEMERRKLKLEDHLNDLCDKRVTLSNLLLELLEQQKERRSQLVLNLQLMQEQSENTEDFWFKQYQKLLDKLPSGLSEAQKNMDPALAQTLLMHGVLHCIPFLVKLTQTQFEIYKISDKVLREAGIMGREDRQRVISALHDYDKDKMMATHRPSAPSVSIAEASAPPPEAVLDNECVICMDSKYEIVFLPCGHLCVCGKCGADLLQCPLCRAAITTKIRVISS